MNYTVKYTMKKNEKHLNEIQLNEIHVKYWNTIMFVIKNYYKIH